MFRKIIDRLSDYIVEKKVLRDLKEQREEYAQEIMQEFLEENKGYIAIRDKKRKYKIYKKIGGNKWNKNGLV